MLNQTPKNKRHTEKLIIKTNKEAHLLSPRMLTSEGRCSPAEAAPSTVVYNDNTRSRASSTFKSSCNEDLNLNVSEVKYKGVKKTEQAL